jgi:hypothetical protein
VIVRPLQHGTDATVDEFLLSFALEVEIDGLWP